jgi:diacylglycerol kinase (ATP)
MGTPKKFLLIINPIAGGNDKTALTESVREFADQEGVTLIEYETTGRGDEDAITKLYHEHKPQRILVAGGDGTVKMVGETLAHKDVILGVLPAGSANGLSVDLELPNDVQQNLEIAFNGRYIEMDMVSINGKKSLHLSDLGANAELVKNYEEGTTRGKLGYALKAFTTIKELGDPFHATITVNKQVIETQARMIVIANTQRYGTGVTINPIGRMDDGKFEIVILKTLDLMLIGKIVMGNIPVENDENVTIISAEKAVITTDIPVAFQIDGEYCGKEQKLDIEILKHQMRVAVPD